MSKRPYLVQQLKHVGVLDFTCRTVLHNHLSKVLTCQQRRILSRLSVEQEHYNTNVLLGQVSHKGLPRTAVRAAIHPHA